MATAKKIVRIPKSIVKTRDEVKALGVDVDAIEKDAKPSKTHVAVVYDDKCEKCNATGLLSSTTLCDECGGTGRI